MSAIFSKSCKYGIQALIYVVQNSKEGSPIHLRTISSALRIPHHFLSKILQTLSRDGIVVSHKGSNGGFELGRHPSQITIMDIVDAIEGKAFLDRCVLGLSKCNDGNPCPIHAHWKQAKVLILQMMQGKTIDDLSKETDTRFTSTNIPAHQGITNRNLGVTGHRLNATK